ncbi:MAG: hypothetical protein HRU38_05715 [Saccharospirillaceae bacterium]|nr:hypothetical protein [Pseudomonadales bacterium]NRB78153.1 hypothetical protein [Saccharospirillaceae bacterium]
MIVADYCFDPSNLFSATTIKYKANTKEIQKYKYNINKIKIITFILYFQYTAQVKKGLLCKLIG